MIGLIQRVSSASVTVSTEQVASIQCGLLALVAIEPSDDESSAQALLKKIINYRIFSDNLGRMSQNLIAIGGELLLVPQFTLAADTQRGLRPSFSKAAKPEDGKHLFAILANLARESSVNCEFGIFGADMQVALVNDGPVTFWLQVN